MGNKAIELNELMRVVGKSRGAGPTVPDGSLESLLKQLTLFGKPRLSYMGDGWYSSIDMHVVAAGSEFKVASEFKHPSGLAAARQCAERVVEVLKQWQ